MLHNSCAAGAIELGAAQGTNIGQMIGGTVIVGGAIAAGAGAGIAINESITIRNENLWSPSLSLRIEKEIAKEKADNPQNPAIYYETTANSNRPNRLILIPVTKTDAVNGVVNLMKSYITLYNYDARILLEEAKILKGRVDLVVHLDENPESLNFVRHYHFYDGLYPLEEERTVHSFFIV